MSDLAFANIFNGGEVVVSCETLDEALKLEKELYESGIRWSLPPEEDDMMYWDVYEEYTCYRINKLSIAGYSDTEYYHDMGYDIYRFSDVFKH